MTFLSHLKEKKFKNTHASSGSRLPAIFVICFIFALTIGGRLILSSNSSAVTEDSMVDVKISSVISLTVSNNNLILTPTPTVTGNTVTGDIRADVSTNNPTGFTLDFNATTTANLDLIHTNNTNKITNSLNASAAALASNTWGYNLKTGSTPTTFLRIPSPTAADNLLTTNTQGADFVIVTIGANVTMAAPPGTYSSTVTFTAVPNFVPPSTMQEITTANCPSTPTAYRDARDGHYYAVQKLADGKCWMLTNLAFGGTAAGIEFTSGAGTLATSGNDIASTSVWTQQSPPYNNQKQWVNPTNVGVTQNSGGRCATAYRTTAASINYTECGYLYNWCAALGSGSPNCAAASGNIINAGIGVCPVGWRLPTGGSGGEFQTLANQIGIGPLSVWVGPSSIWRGTSAGHFNPGAGLSSSGDADFYWSGTAASTTNSNALFIVSTPINSTANVAKFSGYSVRCIAAS
jgi:uncharacterized protein (TIGR02145 family)